MSHMIVLYNLQETQSVEEFEKWLHTVDIPGYEKMDSMKNPQYYRADGLLEEKGTPPYKYIVTIEMTGADDVGGEIDSPEWANFVEDFESRTKDAVYITGEKIYPS